MEVIKTTAPGKLFIIGEYAVTHTGYPAVITPVKKYLTVTLSKHTTNLIQSTQMNQQTVEWYRKGNQIIPLTDNLYPFVTESINTVEQYLRYRGILTNQTYKIHISSELDSPEGKKYGLGSSGAVTVATIKAILQLYQQDVQPMIVYKLATLTHLALQSNGSFGDLAASSFDTLIAYTLFDKQWLLLQLAKHNLATVVDMNWKNLSIQPLTLPDNLHLLVGWTGSPACTSQLVDDITHKKQSKIYTEFLINSKACVTTMIHALQTKDISSIKNSLTDYRHLLQQLSPQIETPALKTLCDIAESYNGAAKSSGAGGGDCGICLIENEENGNKIIKQWKHNGIEPLFM